MTECKPDDGYGPKPPSTPPMPKRHHTAKCSQSGFGPYTGPGTDENKLKADLVLAMAVVERVAVRYCECNLIPLPTGSCYSCQAREVMKKVGGK